MFSTCCFLMVACRMRAHACDAVSGAAALGLPLRRLSGCNYQPAQPLLLWLTKMVPGSAHTLWLPPGPNGPAPARSSRSISSSTTFGLSSSRAWLRGYWGWAGLTLPACSSMTASDAMWWPTVRLYISQRPSRASWPARTRTTTARWTRDRGRSRRRAGARGVRRGRPRTWKPARRGLVVRAMAVEAFTVPRISAAAAKQSGGYAALLQTLELGSGGVEAHARGMTDARHGGDQIRQPFCVPLHAVSPARRRRHPRRRKIRRPVVDGPLSHGSGRRRRAGRGPTRCEGRTSDKARARY